MEGESGVTGSIIDKLHFSDIQGDQKEDETDVTQSIIDDIHSSDIEPDQMEGESGLLKVSLMIFILRISKEIK